MSHTNRRPVFSVALSRELDLSDPCDRQILLSEVIAWGEGRMRYHGESLAEVWRAVSQRNQATGTFTDGEVVEIASALIHASPRGQESTGPLRWRRRA